MCAISLVACGAREPAPFAFPPAIGVWKLKLVKEVIAPPEQILRLGLKRSQSADYEGPGRIVAEIYEMTSSAGAFEAEQKWRPSADTVAFHQENRFTVIHWESADRDSVSAFVRAIQKLV